MGSQWFIADPHFGHKPVAGMRGFTSVERHDNVLLYSIRRMVQSGDTVWWLGDIAFGGWKDRIGVIRDLPGKHIMVMGNHDRCHPHNTNGHLYQREYLKAFDSCVQSAKVSYRGTGFRVSHFPYTDGRFEETYRQWRMADLGVPLIHGHTHQNEYLTFTDKGTPQICVCPEAAGMKPVPIYDIWKSIQ